MEQTRTKQTYAYCRVSTKEQNLDRQLNAMRDEGVPDCNIFADKQSGKDFDRRNFKRLVRKLKEGDTLIIMSIDRLGRDYDAIGKMWKHLVMDKKVQIKVLDMPILNSSSNSLVDRLLSDIILQLLAYVAQTERDNLLKRQAQGIAAAKERGMEFGRPRVVIPDNFSDIVYKWKKKEITLMEARTECKMSQRTFYRKAKEYIEANPERFTLDVLYKY